MLSKLVFPRLKMAVFMSILFSISFISEKVVSQNWQTITKKINGSKISRYADPENGLQKESVFGARELSSYAILNDNVYIFGGHGINEFGTKTFVNDFWKYDIQNNKFLLINPNTTNEKYFNNSSVIFNNDTNKLYPTKRHGSISFIHANKFYLFGGFGLDSAGKTCLLNDIWRFDIDKNKWKLLLKNSNSNTNQPSGRNNSNYWLLNDKLYVLGGDGLNNKKTYTKLCDFWIYDLLLNNWQKINEDLSPSFNKSKGDKIFNTENRPMICEDAITGILGNNLILLGGTKLDFEATEYNINSRVWFFDTKNLVWSIMQNIETDKENNLLARSKAAFWQINNTLYCYGGFKNNYSHKVISNVDLIKIDLSSFEIEYLNNNEYNDSKPYYESLYSETELNTPGSRFNGIEFFHKGFLYLIGGSVKNNNEYQVTEDIWKFRIPNYQEPKQPTLFVNSFNNIAQNDNNSQNITNIDNNLKSDYGGSVGSIISCEEFTLFPNPVSNNILNVKNDSFIGKLSYNIRDFNQNVIITNKIEYTEKGQIVSIDVSKLPKGGYILETFRFKQYSSCNFQKN
jgi:N-acetylneuraminic acid mutarotase